MVKLKLGSSIVDTEDVSVIKYHLFSAYLSDTRNNHLLVKEFNAEEYVPLSCDVFYKLSDDVLLVCEDLTIGSLKNFIRMFKYDFRIYCHRAVTLANFDAVTKFVDLYYQHRNITDDELEENYAKAFEMCVKTQISQSRGHPYTVLTDLRGFFYDAINVYGCSSTETYELLAEEVSRKISFKNSLPTRTAVLSSIPIRAMMVAGFSLHAAVSNSEILQESGFKMNDVITWAHFVQHSEKFTKYPVEWWGPLLEMEKEWLL